MFRKVKIFITSLGIAGSVATATPAEAWGPAAYTMFYDEYDTSWFDGVGTHVQCLNEPWIEVWSGIQTNYSTTQVGYWDACSW
jgi:hypothetical protein